jgi:hypothetical protein
MHPDAIQTLYKWSSKTLAMSPTSLLAPHRPTFSKSARHSQKAKTAPQLVDEILADLEKLRARTRVLRSSAAMMDGEGGKETMEKEIFDDTDFYQGLLRDLINSRTGSGVGEEDWTVERKQKKKKAVDTKASKGRKLRFANEIFIPLLIVFLRSPGTRRMKNYRTSWCRFTPCMVDGMKNKLMNYLHHFSEKDLKLVVVMMTVVVFLGMVSRSTLDLEYLDSIPYLTPKTYCFMSCQVTASWPDQPVQVQV